MRATTQTNAAAIRAHIDGFEHTVDEHDKKWGRDKLRLLAPVEVRIKFDTQLERLNVAIEASDLDGIETHCPAMIRAYKVLDRMAIDAGNHTLPPTVWETSDPKTGEVIVVVRDYADFSRAVASNPGCKIYELSDLIKLVGEEKLASALKDTFKCAELVGVTSEADTAYQQAEQGMIDEFVRTGPGKATGAEAAFSPNGRAVVSKVGDVPRREFTGKDAHGDLNDALPF